VFAYGTLFYYYIWTQIYLSSSSLLVCILCSNSRLASLGSGLRLALIRVTIVVIYSVRYLLCAPYIVDVCIHVVGFRVMCGTCILSFSGFGCSQICYTILFLSLDQMFRSILGYCYVFPGQLGHDPGRSSLLFSAVVFSFTGITFITLASIIFAYTFSATSFRIRLSFLFF